MRSLPLAFIYVMWLRRLASMCSSGAPPRAVTAPTRPWGGVHDRLAHGNEWPTTSSRRQAVGSGADKAALLQKAEALGIIDRLAAEVKGFVLPQQGTPAPKTPPARDTMPTRSPGQPPGTPRGGAPRDAPGIALSVTRLESHGRAGSSRGADGGLLPTGKPRPRGGNTLVLGDPEADGVPREDCRYLVVKFATGRAMLSYVANAAAEGERVAFHVSFQGMHGWSPAFQAGSVVPMDWEVWVPLPGGRGSTASDLMDCKEPVLVVALALALDTTAEGSSEGSPPASPGTAIGMTDLLGVGRLDWRDVLASRPNARVSSSLTLRLPSLVTGAGDVSSHLVAGILDASLSVAPSLFDSVPASQLSSSRHAEAEGAAISAASLFLRAKEWWAAAVRDHPHLAHRAVPLLAPGDDGYHRPAFSYIRAVSPSHVAPSPAQALRMCSLLRTRRDALPTEAAAATWACTEAVVTSGQASPRERAALLCGMLLGLGMDAWVVVGEGLDGPAWWCVSFAAGGREPTFWDPERGNRYPPALVRCPGGTPYRAVHSVLSPGSVRVSLQVAPGMLAGEETEVTVAGLVAGAPAVDAVVWDLDDRRAWLAFSPQGPSGLPDAPPLPRARLSEREEEARLEERMRREVTSFRARAGAPAVEWDPRLAALLLQQVSKYEAEAVAGRPLVGAGDFEDASRRLLGADEELHGVPINVFSLSGSRAAEALLSSAGALLGDKRGVRRYALRASVTGYAGSLASAWVLLAVVKRKAGAPVGARKRGSGR